MTISRAQIRARVYLLPEFGDTILGFASTTTGIGTTGIPDTVKFGPTMLGEFAFADGWGYVPSLTGVQRVKRMNNISTSTLLHQDPANWSSLTSGLAYEWLAPPVHPDEFNRCIQDSMREYYVANHLPETPWADGNFESSGVTEWPIASATRAKQTDALYGLVGSQSLVVTNSGVLGYASNNTPLNVQPGQRWQFDALARLVSGTGPLNFIIVDGTSGSFGDVLATATGYGFTPLQLRNPLTIPDDVYKLYLLLQSEGAADVHAWDALPGRNLSARRFVLDAYAKAGYNVAGVSEAIYGSALKNGTRAYDATSRYFEAWQRGYDYDTEHDGGGSTPNAMRLNRDPRKISSDTELWYTGRRSWADTDDLPDETATSEVPEDLIVFATAAKVARILEMPSVAGMYQAKADAEAAARPVATPPPRRQRIGGRLGP